MGGTDISQQKLTDICHNVWGQTSQYIDGHLSKQGGTNILLQKLTDIRPKKGGTDIPVQKLTDIRQNRGDRHPSSNVDGHFSSINI